MNVLPIQALTEISYDSEAYLYEFTQYPDLTNNNVHFTIKIAADYMNIFVERIRQAQELAAAGKWV